ncbi:hypothetical protein GCM10008967_37170 [Bacillus carboniphilus]|uniref:SWIM-type domain-containing protein n=1 Tax=Bacillus carboniphilus TaxID=86663 RepID=A0ABN0WPA0_9BACI
MFIISPHEGYTLLFIFNESTSFFSKARDSSVFVSFCACLGNDIKFGSYCPHLFRQ